jgi:hypothetical protein
MLVQGDLGDRGTVGLGAQPHRRRVVQLPAGRQSPREPEVDAQRPAPAYPREDDLDRGAGEQRQPPEQLAVGHY